VLVRSRAGGRGVAGGGGGGCGGLLGEERRVLEGGEGGVEGAAERLGERAGVLGCCCADGGHVDGRELACGYWIMREIKALEWRGSVELACQRVSYM